MEIERGKKDIRKRTELRPIISLYLAFCCIVAIPPAAEGQFALTAVTTIALQGNNISVDSFNSQDPLHSDWQTNYYFYGSHYGYYPLLDPVGKREANTVVAAGSNIINVGNAAIYGYVITAPGGANSVMQNGSVGDTNWIGTNPKAPLNYGIQPGHAGDNMNLTFPNVILPSHPWVSVGATTSNNVFAGKVYTYVIRNSGAYEIAGTLTASLYVATTNVVLYLPGGINLISTTALTVGTNADVTIYSGDSIATAGSGSINNVNQLAMALRIYGLPPGIDSAGDNVNGCNTISVGGNGTGTSVVYAPEASFRLNGGGASTYDIVGAFTVHDIQLNGRFNFHYDESLTPNMAPWIIEQPTNSIVAAGSNATFAISTFGSPLNYQWFFNQTNLITNAYQASLVLTNVQLSDAGNYAVVITNLYGSVTSAPASLLVYTDATPALSGFSYQNGQPMFTVSGVNGLNYSIQTSSNLMDWTPLKTNISPFFFVDTNAALFPQRFYRSVFVQ